MIVWYPAETLQSNFIVFLQYVSFYYEFNAERNSFLKSEITYYLIEISF